MGMKKLGCRALCSFISQERNPGILGNFQETGIILQMFKASKPNSTVSK